MWKISRISNSRASARASAGFTLLEILVVVVVVGLLASIAVLNMGSGAQLRDLKNDAQALYLNLQAASDQAVLDNEEIGLVLADSGYYMAVYDEDKGLWQPGSGRLFDHHSVPDWEALSLIQQQSKDGRQRHLPAAQGNKIHPDLVMFSSGETTPFEIHVQKKKDDASPVYIIKSDGVNGIKWQGPGDDSQ